MEPADTPGGCATAHVERMQLYSRPALNQEGLGLADAC